LTNPVLIRGFAFFAPLREYSSRMNQSTELSRERIQATERVIRPHIRRTPILEVDGSEFGLDSIKIVFKLELFQHAGSFKARGAFTNLLTRDVPAAGVVAASGGNHGAAVAFAAMKLGKPVTIFVPSVASQAKLDRIRGYGANLIIAGDRYAESLEASEAWTANSGALPIHAYEGDETLLGQGTLGMELEEQDPKLDSLLVAVGGGGLIGGVASWYQNNVGCVLTSNAKSFIKSSPTASSTAAAPTTIPLAELRTVRLDQNKLARSTGAAISPAFNRRCRTSPAWASPRSGSRRRSIISTQTFPTAAAIPTASYHGYQARDFKRIEEHFGNRVTPGPSLTTSSPPRIKRHQSHHRLRA
jgi:cysteine synthase